MVLSRDLSALILAFAVFAPTTAEATRPPPRPIRIDFTSPNWGSVMSNSGWPLRLRMAVRPFQPRVDNFDFDRPGYSVISSIIFGPSFTECFPPDVGLVCPDFLFRPDQDAPNVTDPTGYIVGASGLFRFQYGGEFFVLGVIPNRAAGIGYGHNDDLHGLVLLSNVGAGRVFEPNIGSSGNVTGLVDAAPLRRRNLAGLLTDVAVEYLNRPPLLLPTTVVSTGMTVPRSIFARWRLLDPCVGGVPGEGGCNDRTLPLAKERVEGSTITADIVRQDLTFNPASSAVSRVRLTAFLVTGIAPLELGDCDNNGRVNAADAECAGFELLSNETHVVFTTIDGVPRTGCASGPGLAWDIAGTQLVVDFDGNGDTLPPCDGGGGGSTGRKVPPM